MDLGSQVLQYDLNQNFYWTAVKERNFYWTVAVNFLRKIPLSLVRVSRRYISLHQKNYDDYHFLISILVLSKVTISYLFGTILVYIHCDIVYIANIHHWGCSFCITYSLQPTICLFSWLKVERCVHA